MRDCGEILLTGSDTAPSDRVLCCEVGIAPGPSTADFAHASPRGPAAGGAEEKSSLEARVEMGATRPNGSEDINLKVGEITVPVAGDSNVPCDLLRGKIKCSLPVRGRRRCMKECQRVARNAEAAGQPVVSNLRVAEPDQSWSSP